MTSPQSPWTRTQARTQTQAGQTVLTIRVACQSHIPLPLPLAAYSSCPSRPRPATHTPRPAEQGAGGGSEGAGERQIPFQVHLPSPPASSPRHQTCARRSLRLRGREAHTSTSSPGASLVASITRLEPRGGAVAEALRWSCYHPALWELPVRQEVGSPKRAAPGGTAHP